MVNTKHYHYQPMSGRVPSGGKRRRTRTRKHRVKKAKRKTYMRRRVRPTKKHRVKRKGQRKTKNRRRRQRGGLEPQVPRKYEDKKDHFFKKLNEERLVNNLPPVPRKHVDDFLEEKRKEAAERKYLDKAPSMVKADDTGNTKATWTRSLSRLGIDLTGHNKREKDRKEVSDYANLLRLPPDMSKNKKLEKVAAAQAKEEIGLNMQRFVGEAATQYDLMKKQKAMLEEADGQIKGQREAQIIKGEQKDDELRRAKNQGEAVSPDDREGVTPFGNYGGGRRRKRSNSRTRRRSGSTTKKKLGRKKRSRKA